MCKRFFINVFYWICIWRYTTVYALWQKPFGGMILYSYTDKERKCLKVKLGWSPVDIIEDEKHTPGYVVQYIKRWWHIMHGLRRLAWVTWGHVTSHLWAYINSVYGLFFYHSLGLKKTVRPQHSENVLPFPRTDTYVDLITPTTQESCIFALHSMFP